MQTAIESLQKTVSYYEEEAKLQDDSASTCERRAKENRELAAKFRQAAAECQQAIELLQR